MSKEIESLVSGHSLIAAASHQVSSDLGGEEVILNVKSGVYYGLNDVGSRIWNLLQVPRTVNELRDVLMEEYEVEPECCDRDLRALLQKLEAAGLIEIQK